MRSLGGFVTTSRSGTSVSIVGAAWEALLKHRSGNDVPMMLRPFGKLQASAASDIGFAPEEHGMVIRVFARISQ
eukprot:3035802-Amphidinium_carterae.1